MTATGHALLGTMIAAKIGNPALAIPLAIASHIITDAIPHWDTATNIRKKTKKKVFIESTIDVLVGFILSFLLLSLFFPKTGFPYVFVVILASQSFDWLMAPYYFFGIKLFKWAHTFQKLFNNDLDKPWGIVTQIAVLIIVFALTKII